jgi:hypothetical protein
MPVSDVFATGSKKAIVLLENAAANTGAPTLATQGVPVNPDSGFGFTPADTAHGFAGRDARESTLLIYGACTAAQVLTGTFTLWGYLAASGKWYEIPVAGGTRVAPIALPETDADVVTHVERFQNLGHFDRIFLELAAIGGAGASFSAHLVTGISGTAA